MYNTNFKQDICHCNTLSLSDPKAWPPVSVLPRRFDHEDGPSKIIRVSLSFWREATTQYLVTREFHSHAVLMAPGHLARKLSPPRPGDQRSPETSEKRGQKNWVIKMAGQHPQLISLMRSLIKSSNIFILAVTFAPCLPMFAAGPQISQKLCGTFV